uniref:Amino acid transporter transmembrane domain-containing protein n=1 Tax=Brassica oleracea TaxID=3712 RepID=A0A3P6E0L7_BRAOL|nr:unnamed protein product [Brassica oleracea]
MSLDSLCPRCSSSPETVNHLFFMCPLSIQTWRSNQVTLGYSATFTDDLETNMRRLFDLQSSSTLTLEQKLTPFWILWKIWKSRNNLIFKNQVINPQRDAGISVLSVPYALASGGWLSLIIFFTIAITTLHCAILIKRCMDMDPLIRSYPDIGYKAFGNTGRVVVSIFMNLELYLVATSFLILEDDNLNKLFSNVGFNFMGLEFGGKQMFIVLVALIILPSVWLDDMRILSYFHLFPFLCVSHASGVFAYLLILASIFWVGAFEGVGFKNNDSKIFRINGVTTSVSLYAFCYCAHPVFPTLYTSMKNKRQFSNVMVICFTICTFIYASVAILGYLMYGSNVESITDNTESSD